jgi:3-hydroxyacyl-CoA dehydrogenase
MTERYMAAVEELVGKGRLGAKTSKGIYDYQGRSEIEILSKRDLLYLRILDHLEKMNAFEPVWPRRKRG